MTWLRGLRARLVITFVLVGGLSAVGAAGLTYYKAQDNLLAGVQNRLLKDFKNRVLLLSRDVALPAGDAELALLAEDLEVGDREVYVVRDGAIPSDARITAELRARVLRRPELAWQRVARDGVPYLVGGSRVMLLAGGTPSGITVYLVESLAQAASDEAAVLRAAQAAALPSVLLAVLAGLLAARGVLRPVADLDLAARRLGEGRLETRLPVRGGDELARLAGRFNETAAALERSVGELREMETRSRRFVADVSHELRTPLAAATAVTDVLEAGADRLDADAGTAARLVTAEIARLTKLVDDLMEISRFDAGAAVLNLNDVDVGAAVAACLRSRGWSSGVTTDLPPDIRVPLDPRRLDVIVANLVGNALRHGAPPVTVRVRATGQAVAIEVADQGPGLPADVLPHVFERFYKADAARARSEGSGLGLAIARENALLHGGDLTVAPGPGAVFTLTLPGNRPS
ncbi:sensor histidine kinase [Streptosporangium minutum]|uniref:histidine kinase n=1 Tax=Streptosporangium minutum TaxID=569862 RepID=A0A243RRI9_9ACTN|nr:HAMP domain-containing sensor histidine kinase [Streptosporangium minutum]OUC97622.1 two-component sensor histidine kinase [Streptosporangium minutum]